MSVINEVLNQLEQRCAPAAPEQTLVRAVPQGKRNLVLPLLAVALALAGGVGAWQWIQMRKPKVVAANAMRPPLAIAVPAPVSEPVSAPEPVSAVPASVDVVAAPASAIAGSAAPPAEMLPPASRLSSELSSVPLPSSLRELKHDAGPGRMDAATVMAKPSALSAKPQPAAAPPDAPASARPSSGTPPMKRVSPAQRADAEFRQAFAAMQQGHSADAIAGYESVLRLDESHDAARQALVALLLENKRGAEAERVLQERLNARPGHTGFAMLLARLQVEHGAVEAALATLEKSLPHADAQAGYQAFFAALLQRLNRHKEAITHYQAALRLAPDNGVWLMGYGISLQAVQRNEDAGDAFWRALESKTLNPELQAFVQSKIKEF